MTHFTEHFGLDHCENPIIIGGSGSTGSTLLSTILNRHPEVAIGPELSLFNKPVLYQQPYTKFKRNLERYINIGTSTKGWYLYWRTFRELEHFGWDKNSIIELSNECNNIREFIDRFFTRYLTINEKNIWGEKTPSNSYYFDSFLDLYPKARIIHIVRDVRDVVASFKKRGMNSYTSSMQWLYNTAMGLRLNQNKAYYQISYEDLVSDTEKSLQNLCGFLNIDFDKSMIMPSNENKEIYIDSWRNKPSGPIKSSSIGNNKKILNRYDYFIFDHIQISKNHINKFGIKNKSIHSVNKVLGGYKHKLKCTIFNKIFYWIRLVLSITQDKIKRVIVMIRIDRNFYSFPGSLRF